MASKLINVKSRQLTDEENEIIFNGLGNRCQALATTTAELHVATSDERNKWEKQFSGVVCFVKDWNKRSFFIRFYDEKEKSLVWEDDMKQTRGLQITTNDNILAITAAGNKIVFLDDHEGDNFEKVLMEKLNARRNRRNRIRTSAGTGTYNESENTPSLKKSSDKSKRKLTLEDIGKPTNVRHNQHIGWNPDTGLHFNDLDPDMRSLFEKIGITDQDRVDNETMKFIYDFVENHGGTEAFAKENREQQIKKQVPPPPNRAGPPPPPPPSYIKRAGPPPPPSKAVPPPPPNRAGPPPPPNPSKAVHPPPSNRAGPPPPPPPSKVVPPPNSNKDKFGLPPSSSRHTSGLSPPPPSRTGPRLSSPSNTDTDAAHSLQDTDQGATGESNPIKQQIMQLLLQNPAEITDFLYNIIDKRGGVDFIKDSLAQQMNKTHTTKENDQEPPDYSMQNVSDNVSDVQAASELSNRSEVPGRKKTSDNVSGRKNAGEVPGATRNLLPDYELSSDMFDDDDDEWNDLNDKVDQE